LEYDILDGNFRGRLEVVIDEIEDVFLERIQGVETWAGLGIAHVDKLT
jgi:hypothetical protein